MVYRQLLISLKIREPASNFCHCVCSLPLSSNSFFHELNMPPIPKPQIKIPSKLKESLKEAKKKIEQRLQEEQISVSLLFSSY
jgi:hypothetical protein